MANILVVAAHPDDEVLGCGGTLARHVTSGDTVSALIIAEGATSRDKENRSYVEELRSSAHKAANILGFDRTEFLGLPDNRLDTLDLLDIIKDIEKVIKNIRPDTIYTHHGADLNIDHRITHEAVVTASRPVPGSMIKRLYCYETVSSTEWSTPAIGNAFQPQRYVDISNNLEQKMSALSCYRQEMRPFPHARSMESVEALARVRGAQSGLNAAEAFSTVFEIE